MCIRKKIKGFTLVEIMVVIAIIGILAAIAFPSYQKYILRSHRVEVRNMMQSIAQQLERQYTAKRTFSNYTPTTQTYPVGRGNARYNILVTVSDDGQSYNISAEPTGGQSKDECKTLTLDSRNIRTADGQGSREKKSIDCWS